MSIVLCVACHRPTNLLQNEHYQAVLAGASIVNSKSKDGFLDSNGQKALSDFIQRVHLDSDGDNISKLNRSLNEMTAVYWMWKNYDKLGDPKIIGLCHYRRYFLFDESQKLPDKHWLPCSQVYCFSNLQALENLTDTKGVEQIFSSGYNYIASYPYDARFSSGNSIRSCKDRFYQIYSFDPKLYQRMEKLVLEQHPDYKYELEVLSSQPIHYLFNMFVTTKEIFFSYCEFIFPILLKLAKADDSGDDMLKQRGPGFLAEFLTSMFITHGIRTGVIRVKELPIGYLEDFDVKSVAEREFSHKDAIELLCLLLLWVVTFSKVKNRNKIEALKAKLSDAYRIDGRHRLLFKFLTEISLVFSKISGVFRI